MDFIVFSPTDAQLVLGFLSAIALPYLVSILKRVDSPDYVKFLISAGCSLILAALTLYAGGDFPPSHPVTLTALVFMFVGAAQAQYALYFKPLNFDRFFNSETPKTHVEIPIEE